MLLDNKSSLVLTGVMAVSIFVFGILDILDNFVILTILTIIFFTIVINIFYSKSNSKKDNQE